MNTNDIMRHDWDERARNVSGAMAAIIDGYNGSVADFYLSGKKHAEDILHALEGSAPGRLNYSHAVALEIGCGMGRLTMWLAPLFLRYYATDISAQMIGYCPDLLNVTYYAGGDITFKHEPVDYILSHIVFQHMPKSAFWRYLDEAAMVLKRGGIFHTQLHETPMPIDFPDSETLLVRGYTPLELRNRIDLNTWEILALLEPAGLSETWKWLTLRRR